ncbi:MAG: hydantoinase/oxoprolinase family protein [bacterium]
MVRRRGPRPRGIRLAFDVGGTFTDIVVADGRSLAVLKRFTEPDDPVRGLREAVSEIIGAEPERILHGTTLATNALLERRGAKVALLTTRGFEDVLEIGRQARPSLYDLRATRPDPLVPKPLRLGLRERALADGTVAIAIDEDEVEAALQTLGGRGVEAVAVCFLHSPLCPRNEITTGSVLERGALPFCLSHEVAAVEGEFERTAVTVANAYLLPRMCGYLGRIGKAWPGASVRIMQSNGGLLSGGTAARFPVQTVLSGPAAGVIGAFKLARQAGVDKVITLDMGGTSTDVCLCDGAIAWTEETAIGGLPLPVPIIDMITVGSGGGSFVRVDAGGALRVGPESAGAWPGPVCYGRGGKRPTLTDAHVLLGRIQADFFLGGTRALETEGLAEVFGELGDPVGLDGVQAAAGAVEVAAAILAGAIRRVSVERGFDPRDFSLLVFGGAGGLHACDLAERMQIREILVPPAPGLVSALGLLLADVVRDRLLPIRKVLGEEVRVSELRREARRLGAEIRRELIESEGVPRGAVDTRSYAVLRYKGQAGGLPVDLARDLPGSFHEEHRKRYGFSRERRPVEVVRLQVRATGSEGPGSPSLPGLAGAWEAEGKTASDGAPCHGARAADPGKVFRPVWFGGRFVRAPVLARASLGAGAPLQGPAVVVEYSATTVIAPGFACRKDRFGNLRIRRTAG